MSKHGFTWPIKLEGKDHISVVNGVAEGLLRLPYC
jgi:hypothetical protein